MKIKLGVIFLLVIVLTTGCSKYEKDDSIDTELYGSYSEHIEATNMSYSKKSSYTFYENNKYNYLYKEIIDGTVTSNINKDGEILSVEKIYDNVSKIILDEEVVDWFSGEKTNKIIYKYKNMIGTLYETSVPNGKTFDWKSENIAFWFDKDGQYHLCLDELECDCNANCPKYKRKDEIIYFQSMDKEYKNTYTIGCYILDGGFFFPELYKE